MFSPKRPHMNAPDYDVFSPARKNDDGVILGAPLDGGQSYVPWIGLTTVRELALKHADKVGLVTESSFQEAVATIDSLRQQLAASTARNEELEAKQERISGLARDGYKVQKVMGRPKEKTHG